MGNSRPPPECVQVRRFILGRLGRSALAGNTGQDSRALSAAIHLLGLYSVSDARGRISALEALRATVQAMQPQCRPAVREAIAAVLDWGDVPKLWPQISGEGTIEQQARRLEVVK